MTTQKLPARRVAPTIEQDRANIAALRKPWMAMGCLLAAAAAERLAETLTGAEAETAWVFAVAAFATAVVIGCLSRGRHMGKKMRRRFVTAVWSGAGWLTYVSAVGLSMGLAVTMVAVGAIIAWPYLKSHRIYGRPLALASLPPEEDVYVQRWRAGLGGDGKPLVGSYLTDPELIPGVGLRYTLELIPGKQNISSVNSADVRGALRLRPSEAVIVEPHPAEPEPTCLVTIVTTSPVLDDQTWPGPEHAFDPETGSVNMGPFVDGEGVARWSVYRKNGLFGGFAQGAPGSGKSRLLETIAVACASSTTHPTVVWFGCGQGGASSKLLRENADNVATTGDDMLEMLRQAQRVMEIQMAENAAWDLDGFTPGRQTVPDHVEGCEDQTCGCPRIEVERQGLLVIVDEFQTFVSPKHYVNGLEVLTLMEDIARRGRKAGVAIILATQVPTLQGSFTLAPPADGLRMCLLEGNGVILRSKSKDIKMVFGVDVDPATFPKKPGYGFLTDPMPGARSAPFRAYYVNDAAIGQWLGLFRWRSLSTRQGRYAGSTYLRRNDKKVEHRVRNRRLLADLDSGRMDLFADVEQTMQEAAKSAASEGYAFGDILLTPGAAAPTPWGSTPKLSPAAEEVLAVLKGADGASQLRKRVMEETGRSKVGVHEGITELVDKGLIEKAGHGAYRIV